MPQEKNILTIPNLLSFFRLCLVPFIMYFYMYLKRYSVAAGIVVLSAVTDVVDGFVARHFNMVSDIGKILDPFADKVTQLVMFLCLYTRYRLMKYLIIVFVCKELIQMAIVYVAMKKTGEVRSARWYGKLSTICLYVVCIILMVIPTISEELADIMMYICIVILLVALLGYAIYSVKLMMYKKDSQ